MPHRELVLTEREEAIAQRAAEMAVKQMWDNFYLNVGKWTIKRALVLIGIVVTSVLATIKVVGPHP